MQPDVRGMYAHYGVRLPRLGEGWVSVRCFSGRHADRHPSARVHLRSGGFRCFTCHIRGGALDALDLLGVGDRNEAAKIAVEYGILEPAQAKRRHCVVASVAAGARPAAPVAKETARSAVELGGRIDYAALPSGPAVVLDRAWTYVDARGVPLGRVRRLDLKDGEKRIWAERPEGDGWKPGLAGVALPLYRLPDVLARARHGERVLLVEGEKAVDALDRLGLFATTNPGGAGKWREQHSEALAGATALAIADCDLPGRLHALDVSLDLDAHGVHVLEPYDVDPLVQNGFDVVDQLAGVAETVRAVTPELSEVELRERLRAYLERELDRQLPADPTRLARRRERVRFEAEGGVEKALLRCERCADERVHRLAAGLAFCPCGHHCEAPR